MGKTETTSKLLEQLGITEVDIESIEEFYKIEARVVSISDKAVRMRGEGFESEDWRDEKDCRAYLEKNSVRVDNVTKNGIDYTAIRGNVTCEFQGVPF